MKSRILQCSKGRAWEIAFHKLIEEGRTQEDKKSKMQGIERVREKRKRMKSKYKQ